MLDDPGIQGASCVLPLRNTYPEDMDRWTFHRDRSRPLIALLFLSLTAAHLTGLRVSNRLVNS